MMTHIQFGTLLGVYLILVVINVKISGFSKQKDHAEKYFIAKSKQFLVTYATFNLVMVLVFIVGFVGMFVLWSFSPALFFLGVATKNLDPLLVPPRLRSGWSEFLGSVEIFFEGALFVAVFFGPARHLFFQP
jgi:hypothetical protein